MDQSLTNNVEIDALQEKRGAENRLIQMTCRMEMKKEVIIYNHKNRDLFDMITRSSRTNSEGLIVDPTPVARSVNRGPAAARAGEKIYKYFKYNAAADLSKPTASLRPSKHR
jgi:hypothetical protein